MWQLVCRLLVGVGPGCPALLSVLALMQRLWLVALLLLSCSARAADPQDACEKYDWDMGREFGLLLSTPIKREALAQQIAEAAWTPADRPVEVALRPMAEVKLLAKPGREYTVESFGGLLKLSVPRTAGYRISSNQRLWIDVIGPDGVVKSSKFTMQPACDKLRKSVAFRLEPDTDYWIQLSGNPTAEATLLITLDH